MKRSCAALTLCLPMLLALQPATKSATKQGAKPAADHEGVVAYRAYVAAIRAGDAAKVAALVEPVPADCAAALAASIRSAIAVEAVKTEMVKRMGPPKLEEEGWNMGQMPDEILDGLTAAPEADGAVMLLAKDPREPRGNGFPVAAVVRRGDEWRVSASQVFGLFGLEPAAKFVAPNREELAQVVTLADSITTAAGDVLRRLRAGEFAEPAEVQSAIERGVPRPAGG